MFKFILKFPKVRVFNVESKMKRKAINTASDLIENNKRSVRKRNKVDYNENKVDKVNPEKVVKSTESLLPKKNTKKSKKNVIVEEIQLKATTASGSDDSGSSMPKKNAKKPKKKVIFEEIQLETTAASGSDGPGPNLGPKTGKKFVGAHVSAAGGLFNAVTEAVSLGATSFALFLRSQRQWASKPLDENVAAKFRDYCKTHDFPSHLILPHGSYLMNCGSPNDEILQKSRNTLVDELQRCDKLGILMYNFHPGSTCGQISREESITKIAESINMAHKKTSKVITVIENMSRQGNTIGGDFKELRSIINQVEDKSRIGVCLDTCHAFAAGYDLKTEQGYNEMMSDFENIIGIQYLCAVHLNDSKGEVGCHLDRHENIGKGHIKMDAFKRIMNDARFSDIPMILETPDGDYAREIQILNKLL